MARAMLNPLTEVKLAWVILGGWEGFRTIMAYRRIKRGRHKGLYRVRLTNGKNAWAREIKS